MTHHYVELYKGWMNLFLKNVSTSSFNFSHLVKLPSGGLFFLAAAWRLCRSQPLSQNPGWICCAPVTHTYTMACFCSLLWIDGMSRGDFFTPLHDLFKNQRADAPLGWLNDGWYPQPMWLVSYEPLSKFLLNFLHVQDSFSSFSGKWWIKLCRPICLSVWSLRCKRHSKLILALQTKEEFVYSESELCVWRCCQIWVYADYM